jgi:hypothetical protein
VRVRRTEPGAIIPNRIENTPRGDRICYRKTVRNLAFITILGGALYVVAGVVQLASPEQTDPFSRTSDYLIGALLALSFLLTLAGFLALHLRQAGRYGGPRGWTGFRAATFGQGAMLVSAVVSLAAGKLAALGFLYVIGVFVLLVGLGLLSVATYRAAILPHWSAYLVAALAVIVFGEIGVILAGLVWLAPGYILFSQRGETAEQPSRVR